ncbi:MAG: uroporphyrinogen-III C-methyltransferase [Bauldia sp.]
MSLEQAVARLGLRQPLFEAGHVWLAGAGPGGLGCLTLDVVAAIAVADAVVYDALVDPAVLQAADGAETHFVGKRAGHPSTTQDDINRLLLRLAGEGKRVLRLKGGDPNIFSRGGEEALALAEAGVPFRFLPAVTAGLGALAHVGIPATVRGINKAIILATGHAVGAADDLDWAALARTGQPIVIYMGLNNLAGIASSLVAGGLPPNMPTAVVMAATTPDERLLVGDLGTIAAEATNAGIGSPAIIVVGAIVAMRQTLRDLAAASP